MSNSATMTVQQYVRNETTQKRISELLGSRAPQLTTSLITALNSSEKLQDCTPSSVLNAALTAASMDLPINQNLGFAYIVPYDNEAQFQMGYKGFIQLAQRSGLYKTINVTDVREGELKEHNRLSDEFEFEWIDDDKERDKKPLIGYVSYLKLLNGFEKSLYMSVDDVEAHAMEYSKSYSYDKQNKKSASNWTTNFDAMARKTVLKLLISKYGPMNTQQLQDAFIKDQAVINDDSIVYVDNEVLSPKERALSRRLGWHKKRFNDLGFVTEKEQKGFIKGVLGKETVESEDDAEAVDQALNDEEESRNQI